MNIDFDINEVTSDILGMIWEKLVELDGETGPISGVTTLFLRSFHDVIQTWMGLANIAPVFKVFWIFSGFFAHIGLNLL